MTMWKCKTRENETDGETYAGVKKGTGNVAIRAKDPVCYSDDNRKIKQII